MLNTHALQAPILSILLILSNPKALKKLSDRIYRIYRLKIKNQNCTTRLTLSDFVFSILSFNLNTGRAEIDQQSYIPAQRPQVVHQLNFMLLCQMLHRF